MHIAAKEGLFELAMEGESGRSLGRLSR